MGSGSPVPPPPPPPARRRGLLLAAATSTVGMGIAFIGSILLFTSTYLPHIVVPGQFGSYSLWEALRVTGKSTVDAAAPIAIAAGVNAAFFLLRARRSWSARSVALRSWALLAIAVNVLVVIDIVGTSRDLASEANEFSRGAGYYLMYAASIAMVVGSIIGAISQRRTAEKTEEVLPGKHPSTPARSQSVAPTHSAPQATHIATRLRELQSLLDDGLITPEEYDARRTRILDDI